MRVRAGGHSVRVAAAPPVVVCQVDSLHAGEVSRRAREVARVAAAEPKDAVFAGTWRKGGEEGWLGAVSSEGLARSCTPAQHVPQYGI